MYNLPVCRLYDLAVVPNSVFGPWPNGQYPGWPSQNYPCPCMTNDANITIDGTTSYFRDFAGDGITSQLNSSIEEAQGSQDSSCYVTAKGAIDCADFPDLCYIPTPF